MKKLLIALSVLVALSMVLTACATSTTAPTAQTIIQTVEVPKTVIQTQVVEKTVQVEITATPVPAKIAGTIRIGSWDSGDALIPFNTAIKNFEAKYPGVTVQLESVPQGYGDKLLTQFAAGTAPDIFQIGDGDVAKFASQGVLEPLDPYITGDNPLDTSVLFPTVLDIGKSNGHQYALTKDYSPLVIFYNKTLFDKAGVAYPAENWTWADFLTAAQKLTKADGSQWGIQLPDSWGDWLWTRGIMPIVYQNKGDFISPDGTKTTGYLNSDATIQAIQWYVDKFMKEKVAPTKDDVASFAGQDLFQTGKVAMLMTGRWPLATYEADPTLNFGTMMLPMGVQHGNAICWAGFGMYSKGTNKDTAWAFLKYIGAEEGAQEFAKYAFTPVKPIAELQGYTTDPYNKYIVEDVQYIHTLPNIQFPKFGDCVEKYFTQELETVFLKNVTVKDAMDLAAQEADACLAKP